MNVIDQIIFDGASRDLDIAELIAQLGTLVFAIVWSVMHWIRPSKLHAKNWFGPVMMMSGALFWPFNRLIEALHVETVFPLLWRIGDYDHSWRIATMFLVALPYAWLVLLGGAIVWAGVRRIVWRVYVAYRFGKRNFINAHFVVSRSMLDDFAWRYANAMPKFHNKYFRRHCLVLPHALKQAVKTSIMASFKFGQPDNWFDMLKRQGSLKAFYKQPFDGPLDVAYVGGLSGNSLVDIGDWIVPFLHWRNYVAVGDYWLQRPRQIKVLTAGPRTSIPTFAQPYKPLSFDKKNVPGIDGQPLATITSDCRRGELPVNLLTFPLAFKLPPLRLLYYSHANPNALQEHDWIKRQVFEQTDKPFGYAGAGASDNEIFERLRAKSKRLIRLVRPKDLKTNPDMVSLGRALYWQTERPKSWLDWLKPSWWATFGGVIDYLDDMLPPNSEKITEFDRATDKYAQKRTVHAEFLWHARRGLEQDGSVIDHLTDEIYQRMMGMLSMGHADNTTPLSVIRITENRQAAELYRLLEDTARHIMQRDEEVEVKRVLH